MSVRGDGEYMRETLWKSYCTKCKNLKDIELSGWTEEFGIFDLCEECTELLRIEETQCRNTWLKEIRNIWKD